MQGEFELSIIPCEKDKFVGAIPIAKLASIEFATKPTFDFKLPSGDEVSLPIPEGSLQAYVAKHPALFSGKNDHVVMVANYVPVPGEKSAKPSLPDATTPNRQLVSNVGMEDWEALVKKHKVG